MRTSILGVHDFGDIDKVIANTKEACQVTHADPRCIASCVAVTTAVALMLQGKHLKESGDYDIDAVIEEAFNHARGTLETTEEVIHHKPFPVAMCDCDKCLNSSINQSKPLFRHDKD